MAKTFSPAVVGLEERLAIVLYGGSSLAIYMNGVVQELLKMVRATAVAPVEMPNCAKPLRHALIADEDLKDSEVVYRKMGMVLPEVRASEDQQGILQRKFVVDILSGSSAGGINGIFLAKALANDQDINDLASLWIEEGDIESLLNDRRSVKQIKGLKLQKPVPSLLNGNRMYRKLLDALENMEGDQRSQEVSRSPYVGELDLFITATDLAGLPLKMNLENGLAYERRHRNVFHFRYSDTLSGGDERQDFFSGNNPFMAFAARCTSSLPFVFEPMALADIKDALSNYRHFRDIPDSTLRRMWERFYEDYLAAPGAPPFELRPFGDGGSLDNSPFTQATAQLTSRRADVPVNRTLIYVEPDPAQSIQDVQIAKPDALQNVLQQIVNLPRQQTITEDLERIKHRNSTIRRIEDVLTALDSMMDPEAPPPHVSGWAERGLAGPEVSSPAYRTYHSLKVRTVVAQLAKLVSDIARFQDESDELEAVRYLVGGWESLNYKPPGLDQPDQQDTPSDTRFLMDFDVPYRLRRIVFVQRKVDEVYRLNQQSLDVLQRTVQWVPSTPEEGRDFRLELLRLKCELAGIHSAVLTKWYALHKRTNPDGTPTELAGLIAATRINRATLNDILERPTSRDREERARAIAAGLQDELQTMADFVATELKEVFTGPQGATNAWRSLIESPETAAPPSTAAGKAREYLDYYYVRFETYDLLSFPIQYGTDAGEAAEVAILRISPADAIDYGVGQPREVAGLSFGHFGAFFSRQWRENDILCGRLDAAQILIDIFGPQLPEEKSALMLEATKAIVVDCLRTMEQTSFDPRLVELALGKTTAGAALPTAEKAN